MPAGTYRNYTTAVYTQPWWYAAEPEQNLIGSDDDFAAAPIRHGTSPPQLNNGKLSWNDGQSYALCEFVFSILELSGGSDDNPRMWEDVAAKSELWGAHPVSPQELQEIYMQVAYAPGYRGFGIECLAVLNQCCNICLSCGACILCLHRSCRRSTCR